MIACVYAHMSVVANYGCANVYIHACITIFFVQSVLSSVWEAVTLVYKSI